MDDVRLTFRFQEALRQRASKASLLAALMLAPHKKEADQKWTHNMVRKMLFPHGHLVKLNQTQINDTWDLLRAKRK